MQVATEQGVVNNEFGYVGHRVLVHPSPAVDVVTQSSHSFWLTTPTEFEGGKTFRRTDGHHLENMVLGLSM